MAEKREREDDAEEIAQNERFQKNEKLYKELSREERLSVSRGFETLPRDIQKIIASVNAGTLMNLARTSLLFQDIGNQEWVWKQMFQRDFPKEFDFCRGELPFFAKTNQDKDKPLWKRFYLNIANDYFDYAKNFINLGTEYSRTYFVGQNVPQINLKWANSHQIREWVRTTMLKNHYYFYDWRATLAWTFICAVVWRIKIPFQNFEIHDDIDITLVLQRFLNQNEHTKERFWLFKYLSHSSPVGVTKQLIDIYQTGNLTLNLSQTFSTKEGPSPHQHFYTLRREGVEGDVSWLQYCIENPPWERDPQLFSKNDYEKLNSMLGNFADQNEYQNQLLRNVWEYLSYCYQNPCIFVLYPNLTFSGPFITEGDSFAFPDDTFDDIRNVKNRYLMSNPFIVLKIGGMSLLPIKFKDSLYKYSMFPRKSFGPYDKKIIYVQSPCISCGLVPKTPQKCGGICDDKSVIYCNAKCQKKHWKDKHSKECKRK